MHQVQLISRTPRILKELYNADLWEEVITRWSEEASEKYVSKELATESHVKAEPRFIKWLREAEEEPSGGEEEGEDDNFEAVC